MQNKRILRPCMYITVFAMSGRGVCLASVLEPVVCVCLCDGVCVCVCACVCACDEKTRSSLFRTRVETEQQE
jgi:hypothetical protein